MKTSLILALLIVSSVSGTGQSRRSPSSDIFFDFTTTIGSSQGTIAVAAVLNWKIGIKQRTEIGVGLRNSVYFGRKKDFLTAGPASKTRSSTTPFLIFFAGQQEENFDTLTIQRPLVNALNITINLGYNLSKTWYAGFNIDLVGITVGRKGTGILTANGTTRTDPAAKPKTVNLLLTGDHDRGTLNSEFFVRYQLNDRLRLKGIYQFIFVEYETHSINQSFSDGSTNKRFRNKANNFGLGISYHIKK